MIRTRYIRHCFYALSLCSYSILLWACVWSFTLEQKLELVVPEGPNWGFSFAGCTLNAHLESGYQSCKRECRAIQPDDLWEASSQLTDTSMTAFGILQEGESKPALQSLLECVRDALTGTYLHTEVRCLSWQCPCHQPHHAISHYFIIVHRSSA